MMTEQWTLLIFLKSFELLFLIIGLLLGLIFLGSVPFYIYYKLKEYTKRQEKAKLMQDKVLPELISKFGKVISIEAVNFNRLICFERNGTLFDLKITPTFDGNGKADGTENKVQFSLPNLRERFYIQHKSFLASEDFGGCSKVQVISPDDFVFYSLNPQFLLSLMEKGEIRDEIYKYQKNVSRKFDVAFENGVFTVTWQRGLYNGEITWDAELYGENWQAEAQSHEQLCQTAVVFYDELAKR